MNLSFRTIRNLGLCGLLFIITGISLFSYSTIRATGDEITEFITTEQTKLIKWFSFLDVITDSKDYLYDFQLGRHAVASPAMLLVNQAIEFVEQIKEQTTDDAELAQIDKLSKELRKYRQAVYIYIEEVSGGYRDGATAREMEAISHKAAQGIVQMSLRVTDLIGHNVEDRNMDIVHTTRASQRILYLVLALSVLCTVVISIVMGKSLASPISKLAKAAKNISKGDLSSRVKIESKDEIGLLAAAFNDMAEKICERTEEIANSNAKLHQEVTDRKRTEEVLRGAKKDAEAANEAKSEFLANMSHEIRTPMNAVIGFCDLLMDEDLNDTQTQYNEMIRTGGNNLLAVINDILDFSKIEAGQLDIEIIDCSLGKLLNSIGSLMKPKAAKNGLEFEIVESNGLPAQICTDPTRLQQCLINLVDNAIKFTDQGGVYVNVSLQEHEGEPVIRFDVEDTGIGIPEAKQVIIFESFSQADGSHTRKYGGTGLGLTITKQLTGLLGGEITLISHEGKGSVFSLTIPAGVDVMKQPFLDRHNIGGMLELEHDKSEHDKFSGRVLVAEDAKTNQMVIKLMLEKAGLEVTIAGDGKEVAQIAQSKSFDLIFMDIQMPNMNGYDATRLLRKEGITTPIIALTANAMTGDDEKCLKAGCDDYMPKPINHARLVEMLQKYLPLKATV